MCNFSFTLKAYCLLHSPFPIDLLRPYLLSIIKKEEIHHSSYSSQ